MPRHRRWHAFHAQQRRLRRDRSCRGFCAEGGTPLFVQISDTHIGFNKDANPDVAATLNRSIDLVNALSRLPAFAIHTGDVTHLSKAEQFDTASQLLSRLRVSELHVVPGEQDVTDGPGTEFFARYGKPSNNRGYYSFDARGVHFVALVNVMHFEAGGLGALGPDQLAWLKDDLAGRATSQPIVVFAHMPLWTIYAPWGWGTNEGAVIAALLRRFGSVTVLCGHIHQIVQKGRREYHLSHRAFDGLPAANRGRRSRARSAQSRKRPASENARRDKRCGCARQCARADRHDTRLDIPAPERSSNEIRIAARLSRAGVHFSGRCTRDRRRHKSDRREEFHVFADDAHGLAREDRDMEEPRRRTPSGRQPRRRTKPTVIARSEPAHLPIRL